MNHFTQLQDEFQKWILFKDRLERGINILSNLNVRNIPNFSKDMLNEIILACVAIDYSLGIPYQKTSCKKSMKQALRKWMVTNYSFDDLLLADHQDILQRLSNNFRENVLVQQQEEGQGNNCKLISCRYTKYNRNDDEKVFNEVYLHEFEKRWKDGKRRLDEKCQKDLAVSVGVTAEPKIVDDNPNRYTNIESTKYCCNKSSKKITEEYVATNCKEHDSKYYQAKQNAVLFSIMEDKAKETLTKPLLTASCYGVTVKRFQNFLSFGIHYLLQLEKKQLEQIALTNECEKQERWQTAKKAHLHWLKQKSSIDAERQKRLMEEKEKERKRQENNMNRQMEQQTLFHTTNLTQREHYEDNQIKRPPKTPQLWADISQCDANLVGICWSSPSDDADDITHFIISVYTERDSQSPMNEHIDPTPDEQDNYFSYRRLYLLQPGSIYWFGVKSVNHYGVSFESRLEVMSKPSVPSCPMLCQASDCILSIRWEKSVAGATTSSAKRAFSTATTGGTNITELISTNPRREVIFIVDCCVDVSKNKWISVWRGQTNEAMIGGLSENSSYLMRVRAMSNELDSGPGDSALFHTLMKIPPCPSVAKIKNPVGRNFVQLTWNSPSAWQNNQSSTTASNVQHQLASTIDIKKYISAFYRENRSICSMRELHCLLRVLGVQDVSDQALRSIVNAYQQKLNQDSPPAADADDDIANISKGDFLTMWNEGKVSVMYMSEEKPKEVQHSSLMINDGRARNVYEGPENKAKIEGLIPNKNYYFFTQHVNFRGASLMSRMKKICTLPDNPAALDVISISNNCVWLRVRVKSEQGWTRVRIRSKSKRTDEWKNVFVGQSLVVQIPNLRPNKTYDFACDLLNIDGVPGDSVSRSVTTSTTPFSLKADTIPFIFRICCSELSDVVEGDLILFTEMIGMELGATREKAVVARVLKMTDDECLQIEVQWCSFGDVPTGTITTMNQSDIFYYEVLRIEWIDESHRQT